MRKKDEDHQLGLFDVLIWLAIGYLAAHVVLPVLFVLWLIFFG